MPWIVFCLLYRNEVKISNTYPSEGTLLNTNTIDAFKNSDKKNILETISKKVKLVWQAAIKLDQSVSVLEYSTCYGWYYWWVLLIKQYEFLSTGAKFTTYKPYNSLLYIYMCVQGWSNGPCPSSCASFWLRVHQHMIVRKLTVFTHSIRKCFWTTSGVQWLIFTQLFLITKKPPFPTYFSILWMIKIFFNSVNDGCMHFFSDAFRIIPSKYYIGNLSDFFHTLDWPLSTT